MGKNPTEQQKEIFDGIIRCILDSEADKTWYPSIIYSRLQTLDDYTLFGKYLLSKSRHWGVKDRNKLVPIYEFIHNQEEKLKRQDNSQSRGNQRPTTITLEMGDISSSVPQNTEINDFETYIDLLLAADGDDDKINPNDYPDSIKEMFENYLLDKEVKLFTYCSKSERLSPEQRDKYAEAAQKTRKVIELCDSIYDRVVKVDFENLQNHSDLQNYLGRLKDEHVRNVVKSYLMRKAESENDPEKQQKIEKFNQFLDNLTDPHNGDPSQDNDHSGDSGDGSDGSDGSDDESEEIITPVSPIKDYYEPSNSNHPSLVNNIKNSCLNKSIAIRAQEKDRMTYPYKYNLYKADVQPDGNVQPTGKVSVESEDRVVLASDDISHFIAVMKGMKANGANEINLNLQKGTDEDKKAFAANAIIAGMMTGVKVTSPYSLAQLKDNNRMITHVINMERRKKEIERAVQNLEQNNNSANEQALERSIGDAFNYYRQFSQDHLQPKEQLTIFACGANAVQKEAVRKIVQKVVQREQTNSR